MKASRGQRRDDWPAYDGVFKVEGGDLLRTLAWGAAFYVAVTGRVIAFTSTAIGRALSELPPPSTAANLRIVAFMAILFGVVVGVLALIVAGVYAIHHGYHWALAA